VDYQVELETKARREFLALPREIAQELLLIFEDMKKQPRAPGARKLAGADGLRLRRGQYRILYAVEDEKKLIRVFKVSARREVYSRVREQLYKIRTGSAPQTSGNAPSST
jgi:mRNA interferase RelE/StbE